MRAVAADVVEQEDVFAGHPDGGAAEAGQHGRRRLLDQAGDGIARLGRGRRLAGCRGWLHRFGILPGVELLVIHANVGVARLALDDGAALVALFPAGEVGERAHVDAIDGLREIAAFVDLALVINGDAVLVLGDLVERIESRVEHEVAAGGHRE